MGIDEITPARGRRVMTSSFPRYLSVLVICVLLIAAGCGRNPRDFKITEKNRTSFLEEIKDMKGLTVEEAGLLYRYVLRTQMSEAFGEVPPSVVGKTIGQLVQEQRHLEAKAEEQEAEQKRLAAEARAKEEALAVELRKAISLTVFKKSFLGSDYEQDRYRDYIVIKCAYENTSGKDIRAFTGRIRFTDLFDKLIYESGLTISDPIRAGQKATWTGTIEYNQFEDSQRSLRNAELTDMKIVWLPSSILFADGTKLGEE